MAPPESPLPSYDGSPASLIRALRQAGVKKDQIGIIARALVEADLEAEESRLGRLYVGDETAPPNDMKDFKERLTRLLGDEEAKEVIVANFSGNLREAEVLKALTFEETEALEQISREYALRFYDWHERRADDPNSRQIIEEGAQLQREREREIEALLGKERYLDYKMETLFANDVRAGELAGIGREQVKEWVRLLMESASRRDEIRYLPDRESRIKALEDERQLREAYLLGSRQQDFFKYRNPSYWELRRSLGERRSEADGIYDACGLVGDALKAETDAAARARRKKEYIEEMQAKYPQIPTHIWHNFF